ncbi:MAG: hypothetical protein EOO69_05460 [Moraxellaceae bacterium]|nr:MAG: hypothetical protein EOO69_05460 [Moraxellaceae bacterium]
MELESSFKNILGEECWLIIAGKGTGSIVSLGFGKKMLRKKNVKNPNLTEEERKYDAEIILMVYCAWRVSSSNAVICSWRDSNNRNGPMLNGLNLFRSSRVLRLNLNPINYDLKIHFDNGIVFEIFCDITDIDEGDDNYCWFMGDEVYEIKFKSKLTKSVRYR